MLVPRLVACASLVLVAWNARGDEFRLRPAQGEAIRLEFRAKTEVAGSRSCRLEQSGVVRVAWVRVEGESVGELRLTIESLEASVRATRGDGPAFEDAFEFEAGHAGEEAGDAGPPGGEASILDRTCERACRESWSGEWAEGAALRLIAPGDEGVEVRGGPRGGGIDEASGLRASDVAGVLDSDALAALLNRVLGPGGFGARPEGWTSIERTPAGALEVRWTPGPGGAIEGAMAWRPREDREGGASAVTYESFEGRARATWEAGAPIEYEEARSARVRARVGREERIVTSSSEVAVRRLEP